MNKQIRHILATYLFITRSMCLFTVEPLIWRVGSCPPSCTP